ncbi:hypothetical protein [Enhygromyxa salina]|uniref:Uncharacterized protein n=1 Tax=Enhygromyxa salina TaxID=215803 RepID=A0A2S9XQI9_9BACT|nr:hypothetical protein [Enhygromyxa salina]PRP95116.1 hypothetical protein ENSA7_74300 [Enhygromyxa salina]
MRISWRRWLPATLLLVIGLAQIVGDLAGLPKLKGFAAATMLSPAPKVFSTTKGLETFSTSFTLSWQAPDGTPRELPITQARYSQLEGPYNRRNVYGAALAYGPVLATSDDGMALFRSVATHGLCGDAPLLDELGAEPHDRGTHYVIHYEPRPGLRLDEVPDTLEVRCPS